VLFKYKKSLIVFLLVLSNNLFGMETRGIGRTTADLNSNVSPLSSPLYSPRLLIFMPTREEALAKLAEARAQIAHDIAAKEKAKIAREEAELGRLVDLQAQAKNAREAALRYQAKHGSSVTPKLPFLERVALGARLALSDKA
jgi:hypothetical protein